MLSHAEFVRSLDAHTPGVIVGLGLRTLHVWKLAETDSEHCAILLDHMAPPLGAQILDAGCGIGEVARLMREQRPDLHFTLLNISRAQLDLAPADMPRLLASYDAIPTPDASFDVVMFNFSICHADDWLTTLREAVRVLRPGGRVFIYDMERIGGDNALMVERVHSTAWPWQQTAQTARQAGLTLVSVCNPEPVRNEVFKLASEAEVHAIFDWVRPMVMVLARDDPATEGAQP